MPVSRAMDGNFPEPLSFVFIVSTFQRGNAASFPRDSYNFISGSSISAAQISGVIALLLEMRPNLIGAEIAAILGNRAVSSQNSGNRAVAMINAEAAINQLSGAKYAATEKNIFALEP